MATAAQVKSFFDTYAGAAQEASSMSGVPASVILAQSALESGYGSSTLSGYGNIFGVKAGSSWKGKTVSLWDDQEGSFSDYRVYGDTLGSLLDWVTNVISQDRYKDAKTDNPFNSIDAIAAGGYATDPNYANKLKNVINDNGLRAYDSDVITKTSDTDTKDTHPAWWYVLHPFAEGSISDTYKDAADNGGKIAGVISPALQGTKDAIDAIPSPTAITTNILKTVFILVLVIILLVIIIQVFPVKTPMGAVKEVVAGG